MANDTEIAEVIAGAIQSANITNPTVGPGITRDQSYRTNADSLHLAGEVIKALRDAGYQIIKAKL